MAYTLKCGDVVHGCGTELNAATQEELLEKAAEHARSEHGLADLDDATLAAVRGAINFG